MEFQRHLNRRPGTGRRPSSPHTCALLQMIDKQIISGKIAKEDGETFASGKSPRDRGERGAAAITDRGAGKLGRVIAANPTACSHTGAAKPRPWASWWAGHAGHKGKANPQLVNSCCRN